MQLIRRQAAFAEEQGLFKAGRAWNVSASLLGCSTCTGTLPIVSEVDFFVSHSWSCASWKKLLAVCFHLNLDAALVLSNLALFLGVANLRLHAGSFVDIASTCQGWLVNALIQYPMAVFLATFFFRHVFSLKTFWVDAVCVEEGSLGKHQTIQAIPAFVAHSKQMLVLWDSTYLERLWCNYEIAVFASTRQTHDTIVVPVWAPIWTLTTMMAIYMASLSYMDTLPPHLNLDSATTLFWSWFNSSWGPPGACAIAAIPFSWFCMHKLQGHERMLQQISSFDLKEAKCTLETDRVSIEQQVADLFDEALSGPISIALSFDMDDLKASESDADPLVSPRTLESFRHVTSYPSRREVVEEFNAYVKGPLCHQVLGLVGREVDIPLKWCLAALLPSWWVAWAIVLGCEGRDCEASRSKEGYSSTALYLLTSASANLLLASAAGTLYFPLALRANHVVTSLASGSMLRLALGTLVTTFVILLVQAFQAGAVGGLAVVATKGSATWLVCYVGGMTSVASLWWCLFLKRTSSPNQRPLSVHT